MMSICFIWFTNWLVLGEPEIYQNLVCFTMCGGFYLEGVGLKSGKPLKKFLSPYKLVTH